MRRWVILCLAAVSLQAAPPATYGVSPLIDAFRRHIAEVERISSATSRGLPSMGGANLVDMAKVEFILAASGPFRRRRINDYDRKFVLSAVVGQRPDELEAHLPAAINYVRIATAGELYYDRIRRQELLWGEQRGLSTLASINRRTTDFRIQHVALIRAGMIRPSQVLTPTTLGELGDPALLEEMESAYEEGRAQFLNQRNSVVVFAFLLQLAGSFGIAILYLQKRKGQTRIRL